MRTKRKMKKALAFYKKMWYHSFRKMAGCGAVGSALPWGGRGRGFKSRHSDQKNACRNAGVFLFAATHELSASCIGLFPGRWAGPWVQVHPLGPPKCSSEQYLSKWGTCSDLSFGENILRSMNKGPAAGGSFVLSAIPLDVYFDRVSWQLHF